MKRWSWALLLGLLLTNAIWLTLEVTRNRKPTEERRSSPVRDDGVVDRERPPSIDPAPRTAETDAPTGSDAEVPTTPEAIVPEEDRLADGARQTADDALRESCIAEILAALESDRPERARIGATAVASIGSISYPRERARRALSRLLHSGDRGTVYAALLAIPATASEPNDVDRLLALTVDPSLGVRCLAVAALAYDLRGDLAAEKVDAALRRLLSDPEPLVVRATLRALRFGRFSREIMDRLLELAQAPEPHPEAIQTLATLDPKPEAAVEALLDALEGPDLELNHAAVHGVRRGIPDSSRRRVADAFARVVFVRTSHPNIVESIEMIERFGDASHVPALERIASSPGLPEVQRRSAREAAALLRKR
jgi:hypothetical protein